MIGLVFTDRGDTLRSGLGHSVTSPTLKRDWETLLRAYGGRITEAAGPAGQRSSQADQQVPGA
ncbi:hypothetical protein [Streptomyces sp. 8N616]|uniref:hypothetical protein n=1 Tax=Streptomyces sp. 8N616 TaxID=3457414 RepID=UPI003FD522C4